jgi:hypothetical protein
VPRTMTSDRVVSSAIESARVVAELARASPTHRSVKRSKENRERVVDGSESLATCAGWLSFTGEHGCRSPFVAPTIAQNGTDVNLIHGITLRRIHLATFRHFGNSFNPHACFIDKWLSRNTILKFWGSDRTIMPARPGFNLKPGRIRGPDPSSMIQAKILFQYLFELSRPAFVACLAH